MRSRRWILGLFILCTLSTMLALGQGGYPTAQELLVNDFANVISSQTEDYLRVFLGELRANNGVEMTILTIGSTNDYDTGDSTIESFATNLFNTWGIGDDQRDDGILLLVAVQDRQVRIEVGSGYGDSLNSAMQTVIDEYMLPAFRQEDYERGIYDGTRAVIKEVTGTAPADPRPSPAPNNNIVSLIYIFCPLSLVGILGFSLIRRLVPRRFSAQRGSASDTYYHPTTEYSSSSDSGSSSSDFGGGDSSGSGASGDW